MENQEWENDDVFIEPLTEKEKRLFLLFQQKNENSPFREPDLSILETMNDYLLNDSDRRHSQTLLSQIDTPEKLNSENFNESDFNLESLQDLCQDMENLQLASTKYQNHPNFSYIKIDPNYSIISEPEVKINIQPDLEGLSILSEAALIHGSKYSKSSDEMFSQDSLECSRFRLINQTKDEENSNELKESEENKTKIEEPQFNDTLAEIQDLLSKKKGSEINPIDKERETLKKPLCLPNSSTSSTLLKTKIKQNSYVEEPRPTTITTNKEPLDRRFKFPNTPIAKNTLKKISKKKQKFDYIMSPVAAYINSPSPRQIQNINCQKSLSESKLKPPSYNQKENVDTNNISMQFPKVDYKKTPKLFKETITKSKFPNHLSPKIQQLLPQTESIGRHIGHVKLERKDCFETEYSLVVQKKY